MDPSLFRLPRSKHHHIEPLEARIAPALASPFPLGSVDGTKGFHLSGLGGSLFSERPVASAGDVNGDGFEDVIFGATGINAAFVVFGKADGFPADLNLTTLDGTNGFRIDGAITSTAFGQAVSAAGDLNGDGFADIVVGAANETIGVNSQAGAAYVIFGKATFGANVSVATLNGANGFKLSGVLKNDFIGRDVGAAGDLNGDGFDDVVVSAPGADVNGSTSGSAFVVFGKASGFAANLSLGALTGTNGFRINGAAAGDFFGASATSAGDVNGDGLGDLIVGAQGADAAGVNSGAAYVIFGRTTFAASLGVSALTGANGFRLRGAAAGDLAGLSVDGGGDVNGDGFADVIVGASNSGANGTESGAAYVVFGKATPFAADVLLGTLTGANGFRLLGEEANARTGYSVHLADDVNGDGFDDVIVSAPGTFNRASNATTYVVYGQPAFAFSIPLAGLNGTTGVKLLRGQGNDSSGSNVSGGDFNGDGFEDIIASDFSGGFIVFGSASPAVTLTGTAGAETLTGTTFADILIGGAGGDTLLGNGGADVLRGGQGDDVLAISTLAFFRIHGGLGNDTLRLDGAGLAINLTTLADHKLTDLERIDLTGSGANTLTLNAREVRNLSPTSNTLTVLGNADDRVNFDAGWIREANAVIAATTFKVFTSGAATLLVADAVGTSLPSGYVLSITGHELPGLTLNGIAAGDQARFVGSAGDVNGDGFDDFLIAAPFATPNGPNSGAAYVVFGKATGFASPLELSMLNGANGFAIHGGSTDTLVSFSLGAAGDFNGDGFGDIIIASSSAGGTAYIVFGKAAPVAPVLELSALDGTNGFKLRANVPGALNAPTVSSAGDVNGDGFGDVVIGVPDVKTGALTQVGRAYVVFGRAASPGATFDLTTLNGTNGFAIAGAAKSDFLGASVSGGDVNGDGFSDVIAGTGSGRTHIVFGKSAGFAPSLAVSALNGVNGFTIAGTLASHAGQSVSAAGDVNGDGLGDLLIGAPLTAGPGGATGAAFVVFGKIGNTFGATVSLATLNGANGFRISGKDAGDSGEYAGQSVSAAGDVNGDGFDDVIVGAPSTDSRGFRTGEAYVIYGKASGPAVFEVAALDGTNGFALLGDIFTALAGRSLSGAGDLNGDGFDDLLLGSYGPVSGGSGPGRDYLIFGFDSGKVTQLGGPGPDTLTAVGVGVDVLVGGQGADMLLNGGTGDVLRGGSGDDVLSLNQTGGLRRLVGGHGFDTLALTGNLLLDLSARPVYRITGFEQVDLRTGTNYLSLDARAVVNFSPDTNTLIVRADASDVLNIGKIGPGGWIATGTEMFDGENLTVLKQGEATLKVSPFFAPVVTLVDATTATFTDVDGDLVTVKTSKGAFGLSDFFLFNAGTVGGVQLAAINLGDDGNEFQGANLTITAHRTALGGDGHVNVGRIDATGVDLGKVNIHGDLGALYAGDAALTTPGLAALTVGSLGLLGTSTQGAGADLSVGVQGKLGTLTVATDVVDYLISVTAPAGGVAFDAVKIGGSLRGDRFYGGLFANGSVGSLQIGGDIRGGAQPLSTLVSITGNLGSFTVGGSIVAGAGAASGIVLVDGALGATTIGGDLDHTQITATNGIKSLAVGGSVLSTRVLAGYRDASTPFNADATIGAVTVAGDWVASNLVAGAKSSDALFGNGGESLIAGGNPLKIAKITSIAIKGEVLGTPVATNSTDHYGFIAEQIGSFSVGGTTLPLKTGASNDIAGFAVGSTIDVKVREVNGTVSPIEPIFTGSGTAIPSPLSLGSLDGDNGFALNAATNTERLGLAAQGVGDVNGDGIADFVVGAPSFGSNFSGNGAVFVVFGSAAGFPAALLDSDLDGTNGFRIDGAVAGGGVGHSVAGAGDVNGDGLGDIVIGGGSAAYVVFGKRTAFAPSTSLGSLAGTNGFKITPGALPGAFGFSVSGAGDVNGDGFADVIVGDYRANTGNAGAAYVIFGKASFGAALSVTSLTGTNGFKINGAASTDRLGEGVGAAGDVNGDRIDDIIIGAAEASPGGRNAAGAAYVIYGKKTAFGAALNLSSLTATAGFRLNGVTAVDQTGYSVSGAGDVNGDGFGDLIIGQRDDGPTNSNAGHAYVVFGKNNFPLESDLSALNGATGFRIDGNGAYAHAGISVSKAGDVNGDGFADVIVGAYGYNNYAGGAYIVYGKDSFGSVIGVSSLTGTTGVKLLGATSSNAGHGVGSVGDVNGDGFDDVVVGAFLAQPNAKSGAAYVVFGAGAIGGPGQVKLSVDSKTATFTDVDGDLVTIKTTLGTFQQSDFTLVHAGRVRGSQLQAIDLSGPTHAAFAGANLTISAVRGAKSGDGFVNVGALNFTGNDFGIVSVDGDLGQIDAGNGDPLRSALASLTVQSFGRLGLTTQVTANASLQSDIVGKLGVLTVKSDVVGAFLRIAGSLDPNDDTTGALRIGGSLRGGTLFAADDIGGVRIGQSLLGGTIESGGKISATIIAHSFLNGTLIAATTLGPTRILGDLTDSRIFAKGNLLPATNAAALTIESLVIGGSATRTNILAGYDPAGLPANPDVQIGPVAIVRDWIASNLAAGDFALPAGNAIISKIASITINGQAFGTVAPADHFEFVAQQIGSFKIGTTIFPLVTGASNDVSGLPVGATGDVRIREV